MYRETNNYVNTKYPRFKYTKNGSHKTFLRMPSRGISPGQNRTIDSSDGVGGWTS